MTIRLLIFLFAVGLVADQAAKGIEFLPDDNGGLKIGVDLDEGNGGGLSMGVFQSAQTKDSGSVYVEGIRVSDDGKVRKLPGYLRVEGDMVDGAINYSLLLDGHNETLAVREDQSASISPNFVVWGRLNSFSYRFPRGSGPHCVVLRLTTIANLKPINLDPVCEWHDVRLEENDNNWHTYDKKHPMYLKPTPEGFVTLITIDRKDDEECYSTVTIDKLGYARRTPTGPAQYPQAKPKR